jgi:hypothetical protein
LSGKFLNRTELRADAKRSRGLRTARSIGGQIRKGHREAEETQVKANIHGAIVSLIDDGLNLNSIAPAVKTEPQENIERFLEGDE